MYKNNANVKLNGGTVSAENTGRCRAIKCYSNPKESLTLYANGGTVIGNVYCGENGSITKDSGTAGTVVYGKMVEYIDGVKEYPVGLADSVCSVTFKSEGSTYASTVVTSGDKVTALATPTIPTGYTAFDGWYTAATGGTKFDLNTVITADITLYARFTPNTYTVSYNAGANGTGTVAAVTKTYGVDFTLSSNTFTRIGYTQTGWATSDGGEKVYDLGGSYTANTVVTLYPVWTDITAPVISGITNGKTYCSAQTVTVSDNDGIASVTVNGNSVTPDTNGQFTLSAAEGEQKIAVTDKAGNQTEITVTVNDGHTGGTADCTHKAVCTVCGEEYGEVDGTSHTDTKEWSTKNETQHEQTWKCCGAVEVALENHEWKNGICEECGYICLHAGGTAMCKDKAVCDVCGDEYGEVDGNNHATLTHVEAKAATTETEGNIEYWHCEDCGKYFGDKDGKNEITLADTVIEKLDNPPTGDSHTALWIALVLLSGGAFAAIYGKKKKRSTK